MNPAAAPTSHHPPEPDAAAPPRSRRLVYVPLVGVNLAAGAGQTAWMHDQLPATLGWLTWCIAVAFAVVVETIALYWSVTATDAMVADLASLRPRLASYAIGAGVGVLNYTHLAGPHWRPTALAVVLGGFSLMSPFLWASHAHQQHREALVDRGLLDPRTVRFTVAQWIVHFGKTATAWRLAVWTRETDPDRARAAYMARRAVRPRWWQRTAADVDQAPAPQPVEAEAVRLDTPNRQLAPAAIERRPAPARESAGVNVHITNQVAATSASTAQTGESTPAIVRRLLIAYPGYTDDLIKARPELEGRHPRTVQNTITRVRRALTDLDAEREAAEYESTRAEVERDLATRPASNGTARLGQPAHT